MILFFGFVGIVWWAIVCKVKFGAYIHIPITHLIPYLLFFIVIGLSLYNWIKIFRMEKNLMGLNEELKKE
jgi:hypothetical protein